MHYRDGTPANNGDKIVRLEGGKIVAFGVLHSAKADAGSYCNGNIAPLPNAGDFACLCDCLRLEDIEAILIERGLDKRPEGLS